MPVPSPSSVRLPLRTARLRLELPRAAFAPEIAALLNDRSVSRWLLKVPYPYRPPDGVKFARSARTSYRSGTGLVLTMVDAANGRVVGGIGLHQVRPVHRRAELGYWVGRPFWRQGYGREAAEAVLRTAFGPMGLHRVVAHTYPTNRRSAALLRRLGFRREGRLRESIWHWGRWEDEIVFGMTVRGYRDRGRAPRTSRPARAGGRSRARKGGV